MINGFRKGQGATEYIIVLAIVLMVALVVVGLLGFFPSFSGDTQYSESVSYWAAERPIAITDATQTFTGAGSAENFTAAIENHGTSAITVTAFNLTGNPDGYFAANTTASQVWALSPGDKVLVNIFNGSIATFGKLEVCSQSGRTVSYNISMTYNQDPLNGKVEKGFKPLVVLCT